MSRKSEKYYVEYEDGTRSTEATSEEIHAEESLAEVETTGPETINGIVTGICVNVRKHPNKDAEAVKMLYKGDKIEAYGALGDFYEIKIGDKTTGFILSKYVKLKED